MVRMPAPLQALVSELHQPVHPTVVMSNHVHVYVSQAHKGELVMGAGVDSYNGYGQRGSFHVIEEQMAAAVELFPIFARAHVLLVRLHELLRGTRIACLGGDREDTRHVPVGLRHLLREALVRLGLRQERTRVAPLHVS